MDRTARPALALVNITAAPDVCKTPTPGGPVPIPYPNIARDADLAGGAKHVTIAGHPVAIAGARLRRSSGDEPGTLGGIISNTNRGKMTWGTSSPNVLVEGKGVIRFADLTHHNCNTFNTIKMQDGSTKIVINYGDDAPCPICGESHLVLSDDSPAVQSAMDELFEVIGKRQRCMIAVVICDCGQKFAARSQEAATLNDEDFRVKAKKKGFQTEEKQEPPLPVIRRLKKLSSPESHSEAALTSRHSLGKSQFDTVKEDRFAALCNRIQQGKNEIGQCAGPRAIALAISRGHRPQYLCERRRGKSTVTVVISEREFDSLDAWQRHSPSRVKAPDPHDFNDTQNVPSCKTCENLIPALLCRELPQCR